MINFSRIRVFWLAILLLSLTATSWADEADHQTEPPVSETIPVSESETEGQVKALAHGEIDSDWWTKAAKVLDGLNRDQAKREQERLPEKYQAAFSALIRARYETLPSELKKASEGEGKGGLAELAQAQEWKRRMTKDPMVELIGRLFNMRREHALKEEDKLRRAVEQEDEARAAGVAAELIFSLNPDQRKALLEKLREERKKPEVVKNDARRKEVERLLWAAEEFFKKPRGESTVANEYKDYVLDALGKAAAASKKFNQNLDSAAEGDQKALKSLFSRYTPQTLLDFLKSQADYNGGETARKLAKAIGWEDPGGNVYLDLKKDPSADDHATASDDNVSETWRLGKTKDEIRKALRDFDANHSGPGHDPDGKIEEMTLDSAPLASHQRNFFQADDHDHVASYKPHVLEPEDKNYCDANEAPKLQRVPLSQAAGWFFRPFPDSHLGSYAGSQVHNVSSPSSTDGNDNVLVNMDTGRESGIPGRYDPVPTPDELYMTTPLDKGLGFYTMSSVLDGRPREIPIQQKNGTREAVDTKMTGVYQSVGLVSSDIGSTRYRMTTDMTWHQPGPHGEEAARGFSIQDYVIERDSDGEVVKPVLDKPVPLCPKRDLALPMLSKDGKYLAAVDLSTHTTKIFEIDLNGKCEQKADLGMFTSKVDFGYPNSPGANLITFHKFNNETQDLFNPDHPYTKVPSDRFVDNIYVYNLATGELGRLSDNTRSNGVYPAFRRDGKITYIEHPSHSDDKPGNSFLVTVDPSSVRKTPVDFLPRMNDRPTPATLDKMKAQVALGALWGQLCSPYGDKLSAESAALDSLNLDPQKCKQMVEKYWNKFKDAISTAKLLDNPRFGASSLATLSGNDLVKACPRNALVNGLPSNGNGTSAARRPILPNACRQCHGPGRLLPFPLDDVAKLKSQAPSSASSHSANLAEEMLRRVESTDPTVPRMPPAGDYPPLTADELAGLKAYLQP